VEPNKSATGIHVSAQVLNLVHNVSAKTHFKEPQLANAFLIDKILQNENDLSSRITAILSQKPTILESEWLQLREITFYLKIAESHLPKPEAKDLHQLIHKIQQLIQKTSEVIQPPWMTFLDAISKEIAKHKISEQPVPSHLETHSQSPITPESFAHIHAEQYISNTGLEGNDPNVSLKQMLIYLNQQPNPAAELKQLIKELTETASLYSEFKLAKTQTTKTIESTAEAFSKKLIQIITDLKPGHGVIIPFGWKGLEGGHSMYFRIAKEGEKYRCTLFNSGRGINLHPVLVSQSENRSLPFLEKNQIPIEELANPSFLRALLEIQTIVLNERNQQTEYSEKEAYTLHNLLKGEWVTPSDQFHHFITPKGVGVCTWGALLAILLKGVTKEEFQQTDYSMRLKSICDLFLHLKDQESQIAINARSEKSEGISETPAAALVQQTIPSPEQTELYQFILKLLSDSTTEPEEVEMLLQKASEQFARDSLVGYREGTITLNELQRVESTLKIIFSYLDGFRKKTNFEKQNSREIDFKEIDKLPKIEGALIVQPEMALFTESEKEGTVISRQPILPFDAFAGLSNPKEMTTTLATFRKWISAHQEDKESVSTNLNLFYEKLPLPNIQNDFWNTINKGEISTCMKEISTIFSIAQMMFYEDVGNNDIVGSLKGLAIIWDLALRCEHLKHLTAGNLPLSLIKSGILNDNFLGRPKTNRNLSNPFLRKELAHILNYLESTHKSFSQDLFPCSSEMLFNYEFPNKQSEYLEIRWIQEMAEHPEIRDKMEKAKPELINASKALRCGELAIDLKGNFLDPDFCSVKSQLATVLWELFNNQILPSKTIQITERNKRVDCRLIEKLKNQNSSNASEYGMNIPRNHILNYITDEMRSDHFPKAVRRYSEIYTKYLDQLGSPLAKKNDLSSNQIQELAAIISGGDYDGSDPHLELQPSKVLAYFTQNLHLLSEKKYQDFFNLQFFEGNFLEILLSKNPEFIHVIQEFFSSSKQFFANQGDYIAQGFLLWQEDFISDIARLQGLSFRKQDLFKHFKLWINQPILSDVERYVLNSYLLEYSYQFDSLNRDQVRTLLESYCFIEMTGAGMPQNDFISHFTILTDLGKRVIAKHWSSISKSINSTEGSLLLNEICDRFNIKPTAKEWDLSRFPVCISSPIEIDLLTGRISFGHSKASYLPSSVISSPMFKRVFKQTNYLARQISAHEYEFSDEERRKVKIRYNPYTSNKDRTLEIQYELEPSRWFAFLNNTPKELSVVGGIQNISENNTLWQSINEEGKLEFVYLNSRNQLMTRYLFQGQTRESFIKKLSDFLNKTSYYNFNGKMDELLLRYLLINAPTNLINVEYEDVYNKSLATYKNNPLTLDNPDLKAFIETKDPLPITKELIDLVKAVSNKPVLKLERVEKNMPDGSLLHLVDIYSTENVLKSLDGFAGKKGVNLWKNEKGELTLLEIPRFNLGFMMVKRNNSWEAHSNDLPGFKLSLNQTVKGLDGFQEGLVVENEKGIRQVLIPRLAVKAIKNGALSRSYEFVPNTPLNPNTFVVFPIEPKAGISVKTREQKLILANIHLARKDYLKAQKMLLQSYSKAVAYQPEEAEILLWAFETPSTIQDADPHAGAVALWALLLLIKNDSKMLTMEHLDKINAYLSIYQDRSQWSDLHFSVEDELILLKFIKNIPDKIKRDNFHLIDHRLAHLTNASVENALFSIAAIIPEKKDASIEIPEQSSKFREWALKIDKKRHQKQNEDALITKPGENFVHSVFNGLYADIFKSVPEARLKIAFAKLDPTADPFFVDLMETIAQSPQQFKSIRDFVRCIEQSDHRKFKEWFINPYQELKKDTKTAALSSSVKTDQKTTKVTSSTEPAIIQLTYNINRASDIFTKRKINDYFKDIPFMGIQLNDQEITELQQAVAVGGSPLAEKITQELQSDISDAWSQKKTSRTFLEPSKLLSIKTSLLVARAEENKLLQSETSELVGKANRLPKEILEKTDLSIRRQGTFLKEITFQDLCIILINKNSRHLLEKNPSLTDEEISKLLNETLAILQRAKKVQKIDRSLNDIDDMERIKNQLNLDKNLEYLDLSEKLKDNLTLPPAYNIETLPEYSLFEFLANVQLYPNQVADLDTLIKAEGANANLILQKIMGSGKSKVLLPILALKQADGVRLPVIVVTSAQYQTTLRDMDAASGGIFEQATHTLMFNRATDCSLEALTKLRTNMKQMIAKKEYLLVTDVTMHALHNKFKEMLIDYLNSNYKLPTNRRLPPPPELLEMRKILSIAMIGILDEADILLNGRHEVNFTQGKPESLLEKHANVVCEIFEFIYSTPDLMSQIFPEDKKHLEEPSFTKENWDQKIMPKAVESFMAFGLKQKSELGNILRGFSEKERALVIDYWKNGDTGDAFLATLSNMTIKNLLAIVKEEFNEFLPLTLNKPISFKYGRSDKTSELLAVPYMGSTQPNPTSRYGHPYVLLNYTTQLYLIEGISQPVLRALIDGIKERILKEMANDPSLQVHQTIAYQDFNDLCGDEKGMNLMRMSDKDFVRLEKQFKENKRYVYGFLSRHIFPNVQLFPRKIVSHHLDLPDFYEKVLGFTGTPYNKDMYHNRLKTRIETGTDGKTLGILKKNSSKNIRAISKNVYTSILDELFKVVGPHSPARTFQDTAALFNGIPNEIIAEELLKRLPHMLGVRYYDKNNRMQVLERRERKFISIPAEKSQTTLDNSFTYFSQPDTTGKDTKQIDQALGFATIGKTLTSRDLFQGVWRLRKLDKNQVAELVHIPEVAHYIRQQLGLEADIPISFDHIIKFTRIVEIRELEAQLPGNVMQKITHVVETSVEKIVLDPNTDLMKLIDAAPLVENLFSRKMADNPYEQFGRKAQLEDSDKLVEDKIKDDLKLFNDIKKASPLFGGIDAKSLELQMKNVIPWNILPKKMMSPVKANLELTVEAEHQTEQEQEIDLQRFKETETESDSANTNRELYYYWNWSTSEADKAITAKSSFETTSMAQYTDYHNSHETTQTPTLNFPHIRTTSIGIPPIFHLRETMSSLKMDGDIFDLEATHNFLPMSLIRRHTYQAADPFDKRQIDVNHFLIVVDRTTKKKKMILISNGEAGYFNDRLGQERGKNESEKEVSVVLGNISLGRIQSDDLKIAEEVVNSSDWIKFTTQAKFFKGELTYTKPEQEYLRVWIKEKGEERMEEFFYKQICRNKPQLLEAYPRSLLGKLIQELKY